jgi:anti-sigma B factor antagonist
MNVVEKTLGNVLVVTLEGNCLDASTAMPLKKRLHQYAENGCAKLVLNLINVEFMDSSGLTVIISMLKALKAQGGRLVLSGVSKELTSLFQLTRLDKVFKIYPNAGQAARALDA